MNLQRASYLRHEGPNSGPIVYWMSRDQRVNDNWALCLAQSHALEKHVPLIVIFCLLPRFLDAAFHHYNFMLKGLQETERSLTSKNISFFFLIGDPGSIIPPFMEEQNAGTLITDYSPLRLSRAWKKKLAAQLRAAFIEVDAHNIVPVWKASAKLEYGASTMRPKLYRLLPEFLDEFPAIVRHPYAPAHPAPEVHWEHAASMVRADMRTGGSPSCEPGEAAARLALEEFLHHRLSAYGAERNDPTLDGQSRLSPYLHFGHISAQRVALEVQRRGETSSSTDFLEELIVRRELADNFCHYNERYDSFEGFPEWAKQSLNMHRNDERMHRYTIGEFEHAQTHDRLWNAAQGEMLATGRMHGYMRMYWAKKILEWSTSPEEALAIAVYLNDTYELDGRDPNGYAGIAWSIGGVHDRAWGERPVYGKVRYMNANGCARKFDVNEYCSRFA
jgi:deoxyribodipyrimidine photo-lyase